MCNSSPAERIGQYLQARLDYIRAAHEAAPQSFTSVEQQAEAMLTTLTAREFNYQSRGRIAQLMPGLKERIITHIRQANPLPLYLDFGGGYHASAMADYSDGLHFNISATEILLLYQIARLRNKIAPIYPAGIRFHIVLDNGVAHAANDIALEDTQTYANKLTALIAQLGAAADIQVMTQPDIKNFIANVRSETSPPDSHLSDDAHHNIERFLGRACTREEACQRSGIYTVAERLWEQQLRAIIGAANGIRLLQRASTEYLSFRPFPGGATRAQCGRVGFRMQHNKLVPTLVTIQTQRNQSICKLALDYEALIAGHPQAGATQEEADIYMPVATARAV